jgi:hypothetical protein
VDDAREQEEKTMSEQGFDYNDDQLPMAFLQWKNTDACFDFYCECGGHSHYDGFFAYYATCPYCETTYQMPFHLFPRKAVGKNAVDNEPCVMMEPSWKAGVASDEEGSE